MNDDMIRRVIQGRYSYKLIDERGRGSFATVYIARALEDNRIYAVKVMHLELASNDEMLARFQREAYILLNLNDPHIVQPINRVLSIETLSHKISSLIAKIWSRSLILAWPEVGIR